MPASNPLAASAPIDIVDDPVALELLGGDVDRDDEAMTLPLPRRSLAACRLQDPLADRNDQPARFEGGNEVIGLHDPSCGMAPAQKGFDTGEDAGGKVDGGLIEQEELISGEGAMQIHVETAMIVDGLQHRGREDSEATFSGRFGSVQRDVGVAQQLFRRGPVTRGNADARGDRQGNIAARDLERRDQCGQNALCHGVRDSSLH